MDIILIEPKQSGNVGAIARVMKNFGFKSLILVDPKCDHLDAKSRNRAKHAQEVLANTKIIKWGDLEKYHTLIGTTGRLGTDYNLLRSPITPMQLVSIIPEKINIGLIFGREGEGLHNDEINMCDIVVSIPSSQEYPVLNISHSVAIILYELSKRKTQNNSHILFSTSAEKKRTYNLLLSIIDTIEFPTKSMRETQKKVWKRLIGKGFLTHREALALMGFFRRLLYRL